MELASFMTMQVLELVDDAVCIRAWMQGAELTGCIALANAAVALQLAAESQQVPPCPQPGQHCRPAHARPLELDQSVLSKRICRHGLMHSRASGGPEHASCGRPVPAAGHAQLRRHSPAHSWCSAQGGPAIEQLSSWPALPASPALRRPAIQLWV